MIPKKRQLPVLIILIIILISILAFLNFQSRDIVQTPKELPGSPLARVRVGVPRPVPPLTHPEIRQGFYINAEGDSVYRHPYTGDVTVKVCFSGIEHFGQSKPNEMCPTGLPTGLVVTAFNRQDLTEALIDVSTNGYQQHLREKATTLSELGFIPTSIRDRKGITYERVDVAISNEYREKLIRFAIKAMETGQNYETRNSGALILINFGKISGLESINEGKHFSSWTLPKYEIELFPFLREIANDADNNPLSRICAAYIVKGLWGDVKLIDDVSFEILNFPEAGNFYADDEIANVLAMDWMKKQHLYSTEYSGNITEDNTGDDRRIHPQLKRGFYISANGDSVYRSLFDPVDLTVGGCLARINQRAKLNPIHTWAPGLIGLPETITAFDCDTLISALIDFPTRRFEKYRWEKAIALSHLGSVSLSGANKMKLMKFAMAVMNADSIKDTHYACVRILLNIAEISEVDIAFGDYREFPFWYIPKREVELVPILKKVTEDLRRNPISRLCAAHILTGISRNSIDLRDFYSDMISYPDTTGLDTEKRIACLLTIRWFLDNVNKPSEQELSGIIKLAYNENYHIAKQSLKLLDEFACGGDLESNNALYELKDKHSDPRIRKKAGNRFKKLIQGRKN